MRGMGIRVVTQAAAFAVSLAGGLACNGSNTAPTTTSTSSSSDADTTSTSSSSTDTTSTTSTTTSDTTSTTGSSSTTSTTDAGSSTSTGPTPFCGDGVQDPGEACDDGNMQDDDACTACQLAVCGDGRVQAGVEECDDGNQVDDDDCSNTCISKYCTPTGERAAFDTLAKDSASGCWDGNPCNNDEYTFLASNGQNFQGFGEAIACAGPTTCVAHVGIATFEDSIKCQGRWDVLCDEVLLGTIDTLGKICIDSAMSNGCSIDFEPRKCAQVELRAALDDDNNFKCCEGNGPDSMIVAVSAW